MKSLINNGVIVLKFLLTLVDILGEAIIDSFTFLTYNDNKDQQDLEEKWKKELYYKTDNEIKNLLKKENLYNWNFDVDGRKNCEKALISYYIKNNYKPY